MVSTSACSGLIAWFELLTRSSTGASINSSVIASVIRSNTDPVHHMGITDECSERFSCDVGSSRMDERFLSPHGPSTERSAGAESRTPLYTALVIAREDTGLLWPPSCGCVLWSSFRWVRVTPNPMQNTPHFGLGNCGPGTHPTPRLVPTSLPPMVVSSSKLTS